MTETTDHTAAYARRCLLDPRIIDCLRARIGEGYPYYSDQTREERDHK